MDFVFEDGHITRPEVTLCSMCGTDIKHQPQFRIYVKPSNEILCGPCWDTWRRTNAYPYPRDAKRYCLRRHGVTIFPSATEQECWSYLLRAQDRTVQWALANDGYVMEPTP
jgi:hypothetical protein